MSGQFGDETDEDALLSEPEPSDDSGVPAGGSQESGESEATEPEPEPEPEPGAEPSPAEPAAPETGDLVIDAALRDLAETPSDDLDAQIERGEQVQRTLQGRLSDLGG